MTEKAIPQTADELEEELLDPKRLAELMEDKNAFRAHMKKYGSKVIENDPDLKHQLTEKLNAGVGDFFDRNEEKISDEVAHRIAQRMPMSPAKAETNGTGVYSRMPEKVPNWNAKTRRQVAAYAEGSPAAEDQFETFGEFLHLVGKARGSDNAALAASDSRFKVLGESQGDQGGFLVPEEFRAQILSLALENAVVRPRAFVLPMSSLTLRLPAIRDTTHATNVHGGVQGYWVPESGSGTPSDPTFSQVVLTAKKMMGNTRIANELLRDGSVALEPLVTGLFSQAIEFLEDDAFVAGIGGGQPLGVKNADALISVTKETGQAATTLLTENIIKAFARMLPGSQNSAVWIINQDVIPELYTMSLSVGTGGAPMFFPAGGISGTAPASLLGRPIVFTEKAETLGTAGDVYLADLSYYLIGDRQAMEVAFSEHTRFANDETDFRIIHRVDGRPWIDSAVTPRNGSNTLSPFVNIATRS